MAVTLFSVPFVLAGMLWLLPHSPVGRAMTHFVNQKPVNTQDDIEGDADIAVGTEGQAVTELRPIGACRLNDKRVDCIAQSGVIEAGTAVQVVQIDGMTIKVKAV